MLTGDKLETATCTAKNAHLITRNQDIHIFRPVSAGHRPHFLLHAHEVAYSRSLVPQSSQFSTEPTVSRLRFPAGGHPLFLPRATNLLMQWPAGATRHAAPNHSSSSATGV